VPDPVTGLGRCKPRPSGRLRGQVLEQLGLTEFGRGVAWLSRDCLKGINRAWFRPPTSWQHTREASLSEREASDDRRDNDGDGNRIRVTAEPRNRGNSCVQEIAKHPEPGTDQEHVGFPQGDQWRDDVLAIGIAMLTGICDGDNTTGTGDVWAENRAECHVTDEGCGRIPEQSGHTQQNSHAAENEGLECTEGGSEESSGCCGDQPE
jgi:hypothetical protein